MASIFQVMVQDRHTDTEVFPFSTADAALEHARRLYKLYIDDETVAEEPVTGEMGEQEPPDGWLYYAVYSLEGDCIWAVEQELDRALEAE